MHVRSIVYVSKSFVTDYMNGKYNYKKPLMGLQTPIYV